MILKILFEASWINCWLNQSEFAQSRPKSTCWYKNLPINNYNFFLHLFTFSEYIYVSEVCKIIYLPQRISRRIGRSLEIWVFISMYLYFYTCVCIYIFSYCVSIFLYKMLLEIMRQHAILRERQLRRIFHLK